MTKLHDPIVAFHEKHGVAGVAFVHHWATGFVSDMRPVGDTEWVGIMKFMFTWAIVKGRYGDTCGYEDRWCYSSYEKALASLDAWDGVEGEPTGWHRHPLTGRRVAEDGTEYINP